MPFKSKEARKLYEREWRLRNNIKRREQSRKYYTLDRENQIRRTRKWQIENPELYKETVAKTIVKNEFRGRKYGLKRGEYDRLFADQGGKCALCRKCLEEKHTHIDHCHTSGKVRGILCRPCNVGLGMFKEDIDLILRVIDYITQENIDPLEEYLKRLGFEP